MRGKTKDTITREGAGKYFSNFQTFQKCNTKYMKLKFENQKLFNPSECRSFILGFSLYIDVSSLLDSISLHSSSWTLIERSA